MFLTPSLRLAGYVLRVEAGMPGQVRLILYRPRRNAHPRVKPSTFESFYWPKQVSRPSLSGAVRGHRVTGKGCREMQATSQGHWWHSIYHSWWWVRAVPSLALLSLRTVASVLNTLDKPSTEDQPIINELMGQLPSQAVAATNNRDWASISQV